MIKIFASAKINLCLDILKKTSSEFHKIQTILHEIKELRDIITITSAKKDKIIMLYAKNFKHARAIIPKKENTAYKALQLIKKTCKIKKCAQIKIKKNIPIASGLGGGSSDAAAVLKGLNKFWKLNLSQKKLLKLAAELSMDTAFFIIGGTALAANFGEKIQPLKNLPELKFKIQAKSYFDKNKIFHKTKTAYNLINLKNCAKNLHKTKKLLLGIKKNDKQLIIKNLHNDFETIFPVKKGDHLSGSGPSMFKATVIPRAL